MNILEEVLAGLKLVIAIIPIIEEALKIFGNTQAAQDMVKSAILPGLKPSLQAHLDSYITGHFERLKKGA